MKRLEDIYNKVEKYEKKFGCHLPMFLYSKMVDKNPKIWSKRFDKCLITGKDMYELGYVNKVFKEYADTFGEPMIDMDFIVAPMANIDFYEMNKKMTQIMYEHCEDIFILKAKRCLESGKSHDDLNESLTEKDVMEYFEEVNKIINKYK